MNIEPRFDYRIEANNAIHLTKEIVENAGEALLNNEASLNDLAIKIQQKIYFKDSIAEDDGKNDYSEWKRLGMFIVNERTFSKKIVDILRMNDIDIYPDEPVIELHIPPQKLNFEDIMNSFVRIYEYLKENAKNRKIPIYIYGISYLSKFAKRYGFEVVDIPKKLKSNTGASKLLEKYRNSKDKKKKKIADKFQEKDIQLCYLSIDDFMDRINKYILLKIGYSEKAYKKKIFEILKNSV